MDLHDKIASICLKKFKSLPKTGKPKPNEWTVLAAIVMEVKPDKFEVTSLGTGSKCIGSSLMSEKGDILNDSHAEIICRRAFLRFLYEDMLLGKNSSIFQFDSDILKFHLKDGLKFHFFTTHVPCGDAAIFPKNHDRNIGDILEKNDDEPPQKKLKMTPNNEKDIYRTGAKCLDHDTQKDPKEQGKNYHIVGVVRTKPGRGDRTLSVSCSDKIMKWCHLGIQGGLLTLLLSKPIYLNSFTIAGGTHFCPNALNRALFNRIEINLPPPYSQNKLLIGQSKELFGFAKTDEKEPCPSSIVWLKTNGKRQLEVAVEGKKQGVTKKNLHTKAARLTICKLELFKYFFDIYNGIHTNDSCSISKSTSYKTVKQMAVDYQKAWQLIKNKLTWTRKSDDLLDFVLD